MLARQDTMSVCIINTIRRTSSSVLLPVSTYYTRRVGLICYDNREGLTTHKPYLKTKCRTLQDVFIACAGHVL